MVDFRRMIPVLAVIAFLLGSAVTASAQSGVISPTMTCLANGGVAVPARSEGLTELGGDLVVTCTGGTPTAYGAAIPQVNVQVFLNTALTSRLLTTSSTGTQWSEALLLLDEPAVGAQFGCTGNNGVCANVGNGAGAPIYGPGAANGTPATNKNVFQAIQTTSNSVTFLGVPIDPPGTTNARYIRITNVRGNANALGVAGANSTPTPIVETISTTPPQFLPVSNPSQTIAFIQRGLIFSLVNSAGNVPTSTNFQQCNSRLVPGLGNTALLFLRYQEQFGTAFKKRFNTDNSINNPSGTAGVNGAAPQQNQLTGASAIGGAAGTYNTESGFVSTSVLLPSGTQTSSPGNTAGLADWGTRIKAVFNNVPNGVNLFVDTIGRFNCAAPFGTATNVPPGQQCSDTFVLTSSEAGSFAAVGSTSGSPNGGNSTQLTVTNGTATAVWEDLDSDPNTFADVRFGVYATFTASPGTNSPALATGTVNGSFAPTSTVTTASNANVPRFADTSTATNIFTVVPCLTTLLFPYVTSQAGFDTGIAISATATDPFGTTPQSGTCTLNWFGAAFTGATPTPNVPSGTTYATLVSTTLNNVTGGFGGYMIAVCRFQFAHGFAFISDLGARNLAMGYLALVIPDPTVSGRLPVDSSLATGTGGEQLNQ